MRSLLSYPIGLGTAALLMLAIMPVSFAASGNFPKGCRTQGYSFTEQRLALAPTNEADMNQTLYLIYNSTGHALTLRAHEKQYDLLGMDWQMDLEPHTWSSFALNKPHIEFTCEADDHKTDCEQALTVCEYNRAVFGDAIFGSYWVVTNKPLEDIVARSIKNGILLRW